MLETRDLEVWNLRKAEKLCWGWRLASSCACEREWRKCEFWWVSYESLDSGGRQSRARKRTAAGERVSEETFRSEGKSDSIDGHMEAHI